MFNSLKHWLNEHSHDSSLFDHPDDEAIHVALASLLYKIVMSDKIETHREKKEFENILQHEFKLNDAQVQALHKKVENMESSLQDDLSVIHTYLKDKDTVKLNFMNMLNHLITLDGVKDDELDVFYAAQKELFPDIRLP